MNDKKMSSCLANNLKKLRKAKGLSQADLASEIGAHLTHVSRVETGKYIPSLEFVAKAAKALGITIDFLLSETEDGSQEIRIEDKDLADRLRLMETLEEREREALFTFIDTMLTKQRMKRVLEGNLER